MTLSSHNLLLVNTLQDDLERRPKMSWPVHWTYNPSNILIAAERECVMEDSVDFPTSVAYFFTFLYAMNIEYYCKYTCEYIQKQLIMEIGKDVTKTSDSKEQDP